MERNHLVTGEKNSKYRSLDNPKEERIHIHCYLPENLYRKMKLLHQDLNTYSLGQIIRKILISFLFGCDKYGISDFIERLEKITKNWIDKKNIFSKEKKVFLKHMSYNLHFSLYCATTYGNDFRPYYIQLVEYHFYIAF